MPNFKCESCGPTEIKKKVGNSSIIKDATNKVNQQNIPSIQQVNYICDSCTPWDRKEWDNVKVPKGMDPCLYNVLNGCWLCNYDKQNLENDYLMDRCFFNGVCGPPCNRDLGYFVPMNSKDVVIKN